MATQVETVRGAVNVDQLGKVLMHEHVFIVDPDVMQNYPQLFDEEVRIADAIEKLTAAKAAGIDTILDLTVVGLGRYLPWVQRVNEAVDINIIAATGMYSFGDISKTFEHRGPGTLFGGPEPLIDLFIKDIREGIADTGVKAAALKCVVEKSGLTPGQTRIATAVAETHNATGAPITVHTNSRHQTGRIALEHFEKHKVDLTKVVIGHAGDTNDLDYLKWIADKGATIGCDRFGLDGFNTTADRIATIATLCKQGYADRIVLAHDVSCFIDYFPGKEWNASSESFAPNWNLLHIPNDVVPGLREAGVSEAQLDDMLINNPRRYFS
ncbi:phosphotriesterase-related protein [Antricoccus suffuscus]|uniref:Phosphotriesterase-related protein n=1 Tax=Antricoccus suffuscus TaxID=1629062 RepID=A0A2T0ZX09_9ACTN|nr:phosphotriesterase [Antricoccus suffuscus]PRZ40787.1 phosphotriesterase-related protein [Antricoccus suffuscus]